jgi:hypothetical protein
VESKGEGVPAKGDEKERLMGEKLGNMLALQAQSGFIATS